MVSPAQPYDFRLSTTRIRETAPAHTPSSEIASQTLSQPQTTSIHGIKAYRTARCKKILKKSYFLRISESSSFYAQSLKNFFVKTARSFSAFLRIKKLDKRIEAELSALNHLLHSDDPRSAQKVLILQHEVEQLQQLKKKWKERLLNLRKLPSWFLDILTACLSSVHMVGGLTKSIPSTALIPLRAAAGWVGAIAGGIAIPLGAFDIWKGVKTIVDASRALKKTNKELEEFSAISPDLTIQSELSDSCQRLREHLLVMNGLKAIRDLRKSIYQICVGSFAVIGGALGILTLCTGGWTAIGIGIAGAVVGTAGIAASIIAHLKMRPLRKRIKQFRSITSEELEKIACSIKVCESDQKGRLAKLLGVPKEELELNPSLALKAKFKDLLSKNEKDTL